MTQTKRPKGTKITTPFGVAGFSCLIRPSTKFNEDGEFNAKVILDDGPETAAFIAQLKTLYEQAHEANRIKLQAEADAKAAEAGKKAVPVRLKIAEPPFKRMTDDDTGEELPKWSVNARMKATIRDKNKKIIGHRSPMVVDSKNNPVHSEVGSGSIIRFQATALPFFTAALGSGLQLKLIGVQVKELVQPGGGRTDFDEVDGFVETAQAPAPASQPADSARETPAAPDSGDDSSNDWV